MNILEEIQNCPVEWKELGDKNVSKLSRGKVMSKQFLEENKGEFPVYSSQTANNGEIGRISSFEYDGEYITWTTDGANAGTVFYRRGKFSITNVCGLVEINNDQLLTKFVYYYLTISTKKYVSSGMGNPKLMSNVMGKIKIPIPPLEIQEKTVQILDKMTEYVTELTSELTSRKKQYSYYRDKLLSFEDEVYQVEWKMLGDIGKVSMCRRILKNQTSDDGEIPFYKIGTFGKVATSYISRELFEDYKLRFSYPKLGDILISASGTIGRTVVFNGEDSYFQDSNIVWLDHDESQVLNRYLYYFYQINPWNVSDGGTISRLYNGNIEKTRIPVPSLEIQSRIVQVLDNFDMVCHDLNIGLPKEIELRQKQYEYFREKLLTFTAEGVYPDSGQWHGHNLT